MGMDYCYSGSASYSRFNEELNKVAEVFGGVRHRGKFTFPAETNDTLKKWFNDIYGESFTEKETKIVWMCISQHPEIKDISHQIWRELETCVMFDEGWQVWK